MAKRPGILATSRWIGPCAVAVVIAWGFIYLFAQLSTEWQVALGVVAMLGGYVLFTGYRAHRVAADALDRAAD